jgi:hypothetical protein
MVFWLIVIPVVLLLLAFAGANWKVFHLAYCRSLLRSGELKKQDRALELIDDTGHLVPGTSVAEVRALLRPIDGQDVTSQFDFVPSLEPKHKVRILGFRGRDHLLCALFRKGKLVGVCVYPPAIRGNKAVHRWNTSTPVFGAFEYGTSK